MVRIQINILAQLYYVLLVSKNNIRIKERVTLVWQFTCDNLICVITDIYILIKMDILLYTIVQIHKY